MWSDAPYARLVLLKYITSYSDDALVPMQSYHRADILKSLEENIPPGYRTHFGKRLQSYEDSVPDPVTLRFEDGSSATCDILIGADGIKSAVRKSMFTHLASGAKDEDEAAAYRQWVNPSWSGFIGYRALCNPEALASFNPDHPSLTKKCWASITSPPSCLSQSDFSLLMSHSTLARER